MPQALKHLRGKTVKCNIISNCRTSVVRHVLQQRTVRRGGIETFRETWEDFWNACDKLKEANIPALSLHTTETAWCPMLLATAYMGGTEEGQRIMTQQFPDNFDNPEFKRLWKSWKSSLTIHIRCSGQGLMLWQPTTFSVEIQRWSPMALDDV